MRTSTLSADLLLLSTALIWGTAFVAQRVAMESMGPMLFNAARFALGAVMVLPLALHGRGQAPGGPAGWRTTLGGGLLAGLILFAGAALQQIGIVHTTAGKAGFITGLYVVIVPIMALLIGHRPGRGIWLGAVLATVGLYLLSVTEAFTIVHGDLVVLVGAIFWALHVLVLGWLVKRLNVVRLAVIQFAVCALLSYGAALATEPVSLAAVMRGIVPVVYGGLVSVGLGYTLQLVAQRDAVASHAAIILSLEAVFAALAGWLLLDEILGPRGLTGCALMLAGMLIAQLAPLAGRRVRGLPQGEHPA